MRLTPPIPPSTRIEIIKRSEKTPLPYATISQTMIRVKDPKPSLEFYGRLGMSLVAEKHFGPEAGDFSLYFLYSLPEGFELPPSDTEEAFELMKTFTQPCIELTHNHGTESDPDFSCWQLCPPCCISGCSLFSQLPTQTLLTATTQDLGM